MANEDRSLLLFQKPSIVSVEPKRPHRPKEISFPPLPRQIARLEPQFKALEAAFERKQAELTDSPAGMLPEQVLILETVSSIYQFVKAVKAIRGMEWLAGLDQIEIEPDELFHFTDEADRGKRLRGQLFLIMTNQTAMSQLLSLWKNFKTNPTMRFPYGQSKWRTLFEQVKNIRTWNVDDRLSESGVLDEWRERINEGGEEVVVEIETWYKHSSLDRAPISAEVNRLITECGGSKIDEAVIEGISYHGILAKLPISAVSEVLLGRPTKLIACDQIMFIRPGGQVIIPRPEIGEEGEAEWSAPADRGWLSSQPIVGVLDGMPLEKHESLSDCLIVDDPDGWGAQYSPAERYHGTGMCSLIINGDLSIEQESLERKIYVRPVLRPDSNDWNSPRQEILPGDRLTVDLIHQAVVRMFEGDSGAGVASTVRIINFSIGDWNRQFVRFMSPLARLLDWLSWKYNVLFIVSAGNQGVEFEIPMERDKFEALSPQARQELTLRALAHDTRNRRLLSPAESINSLTVGASHSDFSAFEYIGDRLNLIHSQALPSPISAHGLGFRRSIKPEILMPGGRQLYRPRLDGGQQTTRLAIARYLGGPPGLKVAAPSATGKLNSALFTVGTSNAAALTTRAAAQLFEVLQLLRQDDEGIIEDEHVAVLLKALLVHGAEWGVAHDHIRRVAPRALDPRDNRRVFRSFASRLLGYGTVSLSRVFECADHRATLLGCGTLGPQEGHRFLLPLPEALSGLLVERRLIVTLAWLTPVNPGHQLYRQAALWFEFDPVSMDVARRDADSWAVRRGTVQHEIFTGSEIITVDGGAAVELFVKCREEAGSLQTGIPYGVVVTLEASGEIEVPIYEQIKARIAVPIRS